MQRVPSRQLTEALSQGTGKTAPDARSAALAELCRAITGLSAHLQDAEDLALLGVLRDAAEKLSPRPAPPAPGLRDFDPTRFQRLLDLAGPSMAGALLAHLQDDLSSCRSATAAGAEPPDWDALRGGSHVLISLAGSVGAASLQTLAEALNAAAHGQDQAAANSLIPTLLAELDALISLVRATPVPTGAIK